MFIKTKYLIPTHNSLRNPELVTKFLSNLSLLDEALDSKEDKIDIVEMEGILYVLNSHHRMVAVDIAYGKIRESELNIQSYTLDEMLTPNVEVGWVIPFDPYFFCRVSDFKNMKESCLFHYHQIIKNGYTVTNDYFTGFSKNLVEPRKVHTLGELYSDI